jgi:uncharacterized protein YukE
MTAPAGPFRAQLDTAVANLALQVNRETVLKARGALMAEADRLDDAVETARNNGAVVGLCGGDPVSPQAAAGFNARIESMYEQCRRYNQDLREAARALDAVALSYGYTESEIAASFGGAR